MRWERRVSPSGLDKMADCLCGNSKKAIASRRAGELPILQFTVSALPDIVRCRETDKCAAPGVLRKRQNGKRVSCVNGGDKVGHWGGVKLYHLA